MTRSSYDGEPTAGMALERLVSVLLRWGSRGDVRRSLLSDRVEDLSVTDEWLLRRVIDVGPVRLSELASWQAVDRSTMTSQVRHLERLGLVERQLDPTDRRAALVSATFIGRRLHGTNVARARMVLDQLLDDWSETDRADLARLLGRVTDALEQPTSDGRLT